MTYITLFSIWLTAGLSPLEAGRMVCIAEKESNMKVNAVNHTGNRNGTKDFGLYQINSIWLKELGLTKKQILHPQVNISVAIYVYQKQGLKAWSSRGKCK